MKIKANMIILLLALLLAGCAGNASATASPLVAQATHINSTSQPTVLQVTRSVPATAHIASFAYTVKDAVTVQRLYAAAHALESARKFGYPLPCPNDMGLIYHLSYLNGTKQLLQVDVQPMGCQWAYLNQTDVRRADQAFLIQPACAIGLTSLIPPGLLPASRL